MSFLAPLFFVALAALAIPVLIHLIQREKKQVVRFPSLMFVQRVPYKSVRRQKLRHILLLIMRCLAIGIIVASFARPFFQREIAQLDAPHFRRGLAQHAGNVLERLEDDLPGALRIVAWPVEG